MNGHMGIDDRGALLLRRGLGTVMALVAVASLAVMFEFGHVGVLPAPVATLTPAQVVAQTARFCQDSSFCASASGRTLSPGRQPANSAQAT